MKFQERIVEAIKESGYTQKSIAQILNISEGNISNWKKGINLPSIEILYKLCMILNVSADYLLGLEDDFGNKTYTTTHNDFRNNSGTINTGTINNTYHSDK